MEIKHWQIFSYLFLFGFGFYALIHADYAKTASGTTTWNIIAAVCLITVALVAAIGYAGQGKRK